MDAVETHYVSISEAARIIGCNESTIRLKRPQYLELFVESAGKGGTVYSIKRDDIPKLRISPFSNPAREENFQNLDPAETYTVKSLAIACHVDRKQVYSLIRDGMPVSKASGEKGRHHIRGQDVIDFVKMRALYISVPEMERLTGINAWCIRDYVRHGYIFTRQFGGRKNPYIKVSYSNRIKELYHRQHYDGIRLLKRRTPPKWSFKTLGDRVLQILHEQGDLSPTYIRRFHDSIRNAPPRFLRISWQDFVIQLSQKYADAGDTKTSDEILIAAGNLKNKKERRYTRWTFLNDILQREPDETFRYMVRKRFGTWEKGVESATFMRRIKATCPDIPIIQALRLLDITDGYESGSLLRKEILSSAHRKGRIVADLVELFQGAAPFVKSPESCLEALLVSNITDSSLRLLAEYQAIHKSNKQILGSEWSQSPTSDFKSFMRI